jgi:hypothetical protein
MNAGHIGGQHSISQSEKFYSEINHAYILVGHTPRTYKIVLRIGRLLGVRSLVIALVKIQKRQQVGALQGGALVYIAVLSGLA